MRKIAVINGARSDYGVLYPVMKAIERHPELELSVIVTGMHLMPEFGYTVKEIESDGFAIDAKVPMHISGDTGATMAMSLGLGIFGMVQALQQVKPDIIFVTGDRGEALAAAIAGAHMGIPVAHSHGGEATSGGCIDESIRHSITRFAHIHFPITPQSAERLVRMGEEPWRIGEEPGQQSHIVGPLGIYDMHETDFISKEELCRKLGLALDKPIVLVVQHPITTQVGKAPDQMRETMEALVEMKEQTIVIYPNADAGGRAMIEVIEEYEGYPFIKIFENLPYLTFVSLMRAADVMMGNSSCALTEAPFFGLPAVDIGIRQEGRERGANIMEVPSEKKQIIRAIEKAMTDQKFRNELQQATNPFDIEPNGAEKIVNILSTIQIDEKLLQRRITY